LIRTTVWGKRVQAVAQNRFGAAIAGIDHARVSALVLALSGGIVALSGALLSPLFHAYPDVGAFPAVKSFVVVVLGGLGSIPGSIVGGLLLGVLENFGAIYVSYEYRDIFGFVILMLVLLLRPQGLFGVRARRGWAWDRGESGAGCAARTWRAPHWRARRSVASSSATPSRGRGATSD